MVFDVSEITKAVLGMDIQEKYTLTGASTFKNPKSNTMIFVKKANEKSLQKLSCVEGCFILFSDSMKEAVPNAIKEKNLCVFVENPRLCFARILSAAVEQDEAWQKKYTEGLGYITIGENASIGENTRIEAGVYIDNDVSIGSSCRILSGAKIRKNVTIGNNVVIGENTIVGIPGFGYERDSHGRAFRLPHIGGVVISDNVQIGGLCRIAAGTIEPTFIDCDTMIDDGVYVGHNNHIGRRCGIAGGVNFSGSVTVGDDTWISPSAVMIDGITIGQRCKIGIGAVVIRNVKDDCVVMGNPAQKINLY